jgi:hypothetical protein
MSERNYRIDIDIDMEKKRTKIKNNGKRSRPLTEVEQIIQSLLDDGAVEITPAMAKKEPNKSIIAKIKYDLAHEC